jgi:hypothetical protein
MAQIETATLYRPVGPEEHELIKQADWSGFPPRLTEQPIFYPVAGKRLAMAAQSPKTLDLSRA